MTTNIINDSIGKGILFPFQLEDGKIKISTGQVLIDASIKNILLWAYNTRYFMEEFGSRIYEVIEEPNNPALKANLRIFTQQALTVWEKRIEVLEIEIIDTSQSSIKLVITYKIKLNGTTKQLTQNINIE